MIVLYIILALLFLVLIALFIDVSLVVSISQNTEFKIRYLFFSWDIEALVEKFAKGDDEKEEAVEKEKKTKKSHRSIDEIIAVIEKITELIKAVLKEFCRYVRLKICHVFVRVATEDAAKTARCYAAVSGVVFGLVALFDNTMSVKKSDKKIKVFPDFTTEESEFSMKIILKIKPIHALFAVMHLLPLFMNRKVGRKNEQ